MYYFISTTCFHDHFDLNIEFCNTSNPDLHIDTAEEAEEEEEERLIRKKRERGKEETDNNTDYYNVELLPTVPAPPLSK